MIAKRVAENTLAAALKKGGDFAEIFCQDMRRNVLSLTDKRIAFDFEQKVIRVKI